MKKFASILVLALLSTVGCGGDGRPPRVPVSGVITVDQKPVAEAAVMFLPVAGGRPAIGTTDAAGRFVLTTFDDGDGAIIGEHKVSVTKVKVTGVTPTADGLSGTTEPGGVQEEYIVPKKYADPETSGLTATVDKGMPEITFDLQGE